jgi:hypothetical protein
MEQLTKINYAAALVHLVAAVASNFLLQSEKAREVQMVRLTFDAQAPTPESPVDIPVKLENETKVDLKFIVVGFFAITSLAHLLYATDFFGAGWYSQQILGTGWNPFRWIEYSLSASLMIYLISAVSGTKEQISAVAAALITPGLMINGLTTEKALKQNALHDWSMDPRTEKPSIDTEIVLSNIIPAWLLYAVHWYIILSNYSKIVNEAKQAGKPIDSSVTFMVFSQLVFFSLFGLIQTYQVQRWISMRPGRIEPMYIEYERAYIILSAVAKLFLAGTVAYSLRDR